MKMRKKLYLIYPKVSIRLSNMFDISPKNTDISIEGENYDSIRECIKTNPHIISLIQEHDKSIEEQMDKQIKEQKQN